MRTSAAWRDSFKRAGFPGPDEEFALARAKLLPHASGKVLVDASCGSGLFTRRFAKSGEYGCVVALDFSTPCSARRARLAVDESLLAEGETRDDLVFVRADIARLPFPEGSVAGVHAGAAIHCWPEPRSAVAEMRASWNPAPLFAAPRSSRPKIPFADDATQQAVDAAVREVSDALAGRVGGPRGFRQWNKRDLEELCVACGLVDFECDVGDGFIFYAAKKPVAFTGTDA